MCFSIRFVVQLSFVRSTSYAIVFYVFAPKKTFFFIAVANTAKHGELWQVLGFPKTTPVVCAAIALVFQCILPNGIEDASLGLSQKRSQCRIRQTKTTCQVQRSTNQ